MSGRAHKTMLAYPFGDTTVDVAFARDLHQALIQRLTVDGAGFTNLSAALIDLFYVALCRRAAEAHGKALTESSDFRVGAGLMAYDLAKLVCEQLEHHFVQFLDGDGVDSALRDEIVRAGRLYLKQGEVREGMLRLRPRGTDPNT